MADGWFSAFRTDGSPSHYASSEPLHINIRTLILFACFLVPYAAFIIILPGMREKRFSSFFTITHHLLVGALLIAALALPYWNVGSNIIVSQFKANSGLRHEAQVGVAVGLKGVNITLNYIRTLDEVRSQMYQGMYFNEKYTLDGVNDMGLELAAAYEQGMPYPLLKVLEYFTLNGGSFCWGRQYRQAGYYAHAMLWAGFAVWCLQLLVLFLLPHQFGKVGILTGTLILIGVIVYASLGPAQLIIPFVGTDGLKTYIAMRYGASFYVAIAAGILSLIFAITLVILQRLRLYTLDTILSSNLDDTVGPKCRWAEKRHQHGRNDVISACSDVSTYISEESTSSPPFTIVKNETTQFNEFQRTENVSIADETHSIDADHDDQKDDCTSSNGSAHTADTKSTLAESGSSGLASLIGQPLNRCDSIGTIHPCELEDPDCSETFARRNFTLPM
uniref:Dual oxidase maturation factor 1-like n=1 Tax=Panagrellus redivivus TaxID=6233 RepID=A0A7E4V8V3_PANRE